MRILKQNRLTLKEMKQTNVGVQLKQDKSSQVLWNFVCKHIEQRFCLPIVETAAAEALRYSCLLRFSCLDLWSPQQQHFQFFPYFYMSPALPSLTQDIFLEAWKCDFHDLSKLPPPFLCIKPWIILCRRTICGFIQRKGESHQQGTSVLPPSISLFSCSDLGSV